MERRILVVDDEPQVTRSLTNFLTRSGFPTEGASSGAEAVAKLEHNEYAVMVTDLLMPGMDGTELIQRASQIHPDMEVVVITALDDVRRAVETLRQGAYDLLKKPFEFDELTASIERALEHQRLLRENERYQRTLEAKVHELAEELAAAYQQAIEALASALDTRDPETQEHCVRVTQWSHLIAEQMGMEGDDLRNLRLGATLHDVGKIGVSDTILFKPAKLTQQEMEEVKKHVDLGFKMLKSITFLQGALPVIRYHHERFDGGGYLHGLKGRGIPLGARIFSIADTVDAMTNDRPYREALPLSVAREEIATNSGKQFDPETVDNFLKATANGRLARNREEFAAIAPVLAA